MREIHFDRDHRESPLIIRPCKDVDCSAHINYSAEIFVVFSGTVDTYLDFERVTLSAGEAIFIDSPQTHEFRTVGESDSAVFIFDTVNFSDLKRVLKGKRLQESKALLPPEVLSYIKQFVPTAQETVIFDALKIHSIVYPLIYSVIGSEPRLRECTLHGNDVISSALQIVVERYRDNITLSTISKELGINYVYLGRCIKEQLREGFVDILTGVRIEAARSLLKNSEMSISEVAYDCGFGSQRNFNRAFRRALGMTPSEYRKNGI